MDTITIVTIACIAVVLIFAVATTIVILRDIARSKKLMIELSAMRNDGLSMDERQVKLNEAYEALSAECRKQYEALIRYALIYGSNKRDKTAGYEEYRDGDRIIQISIESGYEMKCKTVKLKKGKIYRTIESKKEAIRAAQNKELAAESRAKSNEAYEALSAECRKQYEALIRYALTYESGKRDKTNTYEEYRDGNRLIRISIESSYILKCKTVKLKKK